MTPDLLLPITLLFVSIAVITGLGTSAVLARNVPERRRLREMAHPGHGTESLQLDRPGLVEQLDPRLERVAGLLPKSPKEMGRLRRRLAVAGINSFAPAVVYSIAELTLPVMLGLPAFFFMTGPMKYIGTAVAVLVGYMIPGLILARLITVQKRRIEDGLPDALDLMIVCVEAGTALDQAIMKASEELMISHPALALELQTITTEIRAGKPRIEAFKNFAERTKVDDVRSLVAMLVQTDRFGTSVAQALRTHAETSRTKRRQRAEERAAKIGVKLVFPLVFFLFPAFYVVTLGPAVIQFVNIFFPLADK
ncbi:MAG: type II secretion system F family protein [Acidobacteria bacterium]|nr:type II secretion system F family protein [Acidobacteriota bacterium]